MPYHEGVLSIIKILTKSTDLTIKFPWVALLSPSGLTLIGA